MASGSMGGAPHAASQNRGPPPAEGSSAGLPYIGSTISLISKAEIRYEGTLYTIDTKESSISLQNVRSFGTEGRKTTPPQIPASPDLYDFIIFRGVDIKELSVTEPSGPAPVPQPHVDPAIMSAGSKVPLGGSALPGASGLGYPPSLYGGGFSSPWGPPPPASGSSPWAPGGVAPPPSAFTYPMQHPHQHQLGPQSHLQQLQQPQQQAVPAQKAPPQHVANAGPPAQVVPAPSAAPAQPAPAKPQTAAQVVAAPPKAAPQQRPSGNPWGRGAPALAPPSGAAVPTRAPGAPNGANHAVSTVSAAPSGSYASAAAAVRAGGVGRGGAGRGVMPGRGAPPAQGAGRGRRPPAALAEAVPQKARPVAPPTAAGAAASAAAAAAMRLTRVIVPAEDFDFAANLEKFDKASLFKDTPAAASVQTPEPEAPSKPLYEKDDFFDMMSCEALERLSLVEANKSNARAGKSFSEQRKIDKETFGASSYNRSRAGGRGRRGGGSTGSAPGSYSQHNQQGSGGMYSGDARDVGGRGGGGRRGGGQAGRGGRGNGMRPMSTGRA